MGRQMRVEGLNEMLATLSRLPEEFKGRPVQRSLRAGLSIIQKEAQRLAPVDEGRIQANIMLRQIPAKDLGAGVSEGVYITVRRDRKMDRHDPRNAWYWHIQEFGSIFQPGKPFLRPAFDANKRQAVDEYAAQFRSLIDTAVKKARGQPGSYGNRRTQVR